MSEPVQLITAISGRVKLGLVRDRHRANLPTGYISKRGIK
jgi:hypothetical protein